VIEFEPLAPFDLELSCLVFADGDKRVRCFQEGGFSQVVCTDEGLVLIRVVSVGCVDKPRLRVELCGEGFLSERCVDQAVGVVKRVFSLDLSLLSFYDFVYEDRVMSQVVQRLCGFKFPVTPLVFEAIVDAIVEQQISIKVARSVEDKLAVLFGESISVGGELFFAFPTAKALVDAGAEAVKRAGLSGRKAEYICGLAELVVRGVLDFDKMMKHGLDEIILELDKIRGVGVWTAELSVLRGFGRFDVFPADDFGLRRVISRYYCGGRVIDAIEARLVAERWGRWKGLAAFYLIAAEALNLEF
jgi:DNA-3-methyladenine glycosylase II